jgi:hypothetical protein
MQQQVNKLKRGREETDRQFYIYTITCTLPLTARVPQYNHAILISENKLEIPSFLFIPAKSNELVDDDSYLFKHEYRLSMNMSTDQLSKLFRWYLEFLDKDAIDYKIVRSAIRNQNLVTGFGLILPIFDIASLDHEIQVLGEDLNGEDFVTLVQNNMIAGDQVMVTPRSVVEPNNTSAFLNQLVISLDGSQLFVIRDFQNVDNCCCVQLGNIDDVAPHRLKDATNTVSIDIGSVKFSNMSINLLRILERKKQINLFNNDMHSHFQRLSEFESIIGYDFSDKLLLRRALINDSFASMHGNRIHCNEALEFVGDAVLDVVLIHYFYRNGADLPHTAREKIATNAWLGSLGTVRKIEDFIISMYRPSYKQRSDVTEAICGK